MPTRGNSASSNAAQPDPSLSFAKAKRELESAFIKQSDTLLSNVRPLSEGGYLGLVEDLKIMAYKFGWDDFLWDLSLPDEPEQFYVDLENKKDNDLDSLKEFLDIKAVYVTLMLKCQSHKVRHLLKHITAGRPRAVLRRIHEHEFPADTAGKGKQNKKFMLATQGNTNTCLLQWVAYVENQAEVIRSMGNPGDVSDSLMMMVFLDGLLPQFEKIKDVVEQIPNCTFEEAASRVSAWATTKGLADLTRGASEPRDRVYFGQAATPAARQPTPNVREKRRLTVEEKALLPCPRYSTLRNLVIDNLCT